MEQARKKIISVVVGAIVGIVAVLLIIVLFSFIIVKSESVNYYLLMPFGIAAACIGAFSGGFVSARISGSAGMLIGAVSGAFMFILLLGAGAVLGELPEAVSFLRLVLMVLSGAIGGVVGVNGKRKRRRRI